MIVDKNSLKEYLKADKEALGIKCKFVPLFGKEIWKFEISLRYYEFYLNRGGKLQTIFWKFVNHHYAIKLGYTIPPNTCGKGLNIHHYGCVVINENARLGEYCNIQQCVNIGQNHGANNCPVIGDHVYIGPGAKIFGKVTIANGIAIGAGSVVTRSFLNENTTIVGNPAREIGTRKPGIY
mgnify:FL=1